MKNIGLLAGLVLFSSASFADFLPQSFTSKFEQEYTSTLKGKTKRGQGAIEYKYPGQIRFETNTPSTVIFVSNGTKSWYYRAPFIEGEQGEVTEATSKEGSNIYIRFFDSLKNGLVSNDLYDVKKGEPATIIFKAKTSKELGIKESVIYFKTKGSQKFEDVDTIELVFPDGKRSKLKFVDLKVNQGPGADRFNFTPPANTKKVN
nr:outer membrane lipoprotein carrier protein LolA [Bacteriovorax sp. HI3]